MLTILSIVFSSILFADATIWVCSSAQSSSNPDEWTFSVCADSDENIAGYQFGVDIAGFTVTSVDLGAASSAAGLSENGNTFSLAFSFTGAFVPAGNNLELAVFTGTVDSNAGGDALVVSGGGSLVMSDPLATQITITSAANGWDGTMLGDNTMLPGNYSLSEAYPNPFNPTTTIDYALRENGNVSIIVYDLMGRIVRELVNEFQFADGGITHSVVWNGADNSGNMVSSGIYIYRMISNDFTKSHRITLMK